MQTSIIACRTIEDEINTVLRNLQLSLPICWIESGLHNFPAKLRERIQQEIDKISGVDHILLLFGYCGNSLEGLIASQAQLVVPKVDDCISLLLGGNRQRIEQSLRTPAFYLTGGWLRYENNIFKEYKHMVAKYGEVRAGRVFKTMLAHYKFLNFIDTNSYNLVSLMETTADIAAKINLQQQVVPGTLNLIAKALREEWDEEFLRVPAGVPLHIDYTTAVPLHQF